jgi:signal transduction histidine kinase
MERHIAEISDTRTIPEWWPHVMLGVASALLLALLVVTLYYANTARRLLTELQQYAWQVDKVDALLIQLLNAETGARGFLVTGDAAFLAPYREGVANMSDLLSDIDSHPEKPQLNAKEYTHLKHLINDELTALSAAIDARQSSDYTPKQLMESGHRTMDEIRDSLNTIRSRISSDNATYYVTSLAFLGNSRWVVASLFTGAFILLLGLYTLLQKQVGLRRRIASMMSSENERLERLVKQRTVELNDLATYLTRVSEAEKHRIAQELHDEMGALLTAARMDTTWIARDLDPAVKEKYARRLARLSKSIDAAINLKRKITTDLKPPLLQELGLIESLRAMAEDLGTDGVHEVRINLPDTAPAVDEEKTLAIFRIIQESLTNIRKYASARNIEVGMQVKDGGIDLRIADDGLGFDIRRLKPGGHGILGMRHRAQMFGGDLRVSSTPGGGCVIEARIPLHNPKGE